MSRPVLTYDNIICWFDRFRKFDMKNLEHCRRLTDVFLHSVFLEDDKMVVTFNYRLGTKAITLADIQKSALGSDLSAITAQMSKRRWQSTVPLTLDMVFWMKNPNIARSAML